MAITINYDHAEVVLTALFNTAEAMLIAQETNLRVPEVDDALSVVFSSSTQAFREALLGCFLAKLVDSTINVRTPYVSQGEDAYNGRTLDERVINPILQQRRIPCSRGPFLSVFRRSVEFTLATRDGVRDKSGYDAFLSVIAFIEDTPADENDSSGPPSTFGPFFAATYSAVYRFLELREASNVPLNRIQRMSLGQITSLIAKLLATPSGGRLPMYIVVAVLQATKEHLGLDWSIQWEGINVADARSGLGGDIVVSSGGSTFWVAEVTEREVGRDRIVATFNNKIGPDQISDYLFFTQSKDQPAEAVDQMRRYFTQGHELNFVVVQDWSEAVLATIGSAGRILFVRHMLDLLDTDDTPAALKVAWNELVNEVVNQ